MNNLIALDVKRQICAAVEVTYPGVVVDWTGEHPELILPVSMKDNGWKEVLKFMTSYSFKLGVVIEFPS